jgi:hypothetical protein
MAPRRELKATHLKPAKTKRVSDACKASVAMDNPAKALRESTIRKGSSHADEIRCKSNLAISKI